MILSDFITLQDAYRGIRYGSHKESATIFCSTHPTRQEIYHMSRKYPTAQYVVLLNSSPKIIAKSHNSDGCAKIKISGNKTAFVFQDKMFVMELDKENLTAHILDHSGLIKQQVQFHDKKSLVDYGNNLTRSEIHDIYEFFKISSVFDVKMVKQGQIKYDATKPFYRRDYTNFLADSDRYRTDKYQISASLRGHKDAYSIGCHVFSTQLGLISFSRYWHYELNKKSEADATFDKVCQAIDEIINEVESDRSPMTAVMTRFRVAVSQLDLNHQEKSGVAGFNWYLTVPQERDWTKSLYGNRYPTTDLETLEDLNWNVDEQSKQVIQTGKGRSAMKTYMYNQEDAENSQWTAKYAYQEMAAVEARQIMLELLNKYGLDWDKIAPELRQRGVPQEMMSDLHYRYINYQMSAMGSKNI